MKKETAINFLLYSYFGITLDSVPDKIVDAAINRAYQDASSHVLALTDNEKNKAKEKSNEPKGTCIKKIKDFVGKLASVKSQEDYTEKHESLSNDLRDIYDGVTEEGYGFTYGVAQKWINMTMKYLCVILAVFEEFKESHDYCKSYSAVLHQCEGFFHIPLDSYILEFISESEQKSQKIDDALHIPIPAKAGGNCFYSDKALAWSKYDDYDQYLDVEKEIKESITESPLDWEGPAWIKVSQKRKESRDNRQKHSVL